MSETLAKLLELAAQEVETDFLFEFATELEDQAYKAKQIDDLLRLIDEELDGSRESTTEDYKLLLKERLRMVYTLLTVTQERADGLHRDLTWLANACMSAKKQAKEKASAGVGAHTGAQE